MKESCGAPAAWLVVAACLVACTPLRPERPGSATAPGAATSATAPAASASPSVDELAASIAVDAQRSDDETEAKVRESLAADAQRDSANCLALAPQAAACLYYDAVARGLEARVHPLRADELLKSMLDSLVRADAADADYDHAGPSRVRALVLLRAPGWPLGPGDPDAALIAAHRAVSLQPDYPPNLLALAEAFGKTGDANDARQAYERAHDLSQSMPPSGNRDRWLRQATQGLEHP